jgi:glycogen synthase
VRIALAIHEYPPVGGGAATAAAHTARALAADGHDVLVVTAGGGGLPDQEHHDRLAVVRLPSLRLERLAPSAAELLSFCASAAIMLEDRLRRFGAEAVLAYFAVPVGPFAVRAARRLGVPVVVSLRGSDVPGFRHGRLEGRLGVLAHPVIRWTLRRADAVAPNCPALRELALGFMPELAPKLAVVANGIEEAAIAAAPAASGDAALHLVQVGQLIRRKRVDVTLAAVARLAGRGIATRLTVIGDGPLHGELVARAAALGVAGQVEFAGHLPRASIIERLRRHDVFVMPSVAEGMSNALLEAMAAGLPVVTTPSGSHDLVAGSGGGVIVPFDDPDALAAAVAALAGEPSRRTAMARAGLAHARTLTWRATARGFVRLLAYRGEPT